MSTWSLTYRQAYFSDSRVKIFLRILPTRWQRIPAGKDMEWNYVTVTPCTKLQGCCQRRWLMQQWYHFVNGRGVKLLHPREWQKVLRWQNVCMPIYLHISKTGPNFIKFSAYFLPSSDTGLLSKCHFRHIDTAGRKRPDSLALMTMCPTFRKQCQTSSCQPLASFGF